MVGAPMVVADLPVLREVLRADGEAPVRFVAPSDVDGWTSAIRAALTAPPPQQVTATFARTIRRRYSLQRMIESYLSLLDERVKRRQGDQEPARWRSAAQATEEARR